MVFRQNFIDVKGVLSGASGTGIQTRNKTEPLISGTSFSVWSDARYDENRVEFVVGVVIRNEGCALMAAGGRRIKSPGSVLAAKLIGILEGIRLLKGLGENRGVFWSDSMEDVGAIMNGNYLWNAAGVVRNQVLKEFEGFLVWEIAFTPRLQNRAAHEVANFVCSSSLPHAWYGDDLSLWLQEIA
ncbi:hypothetical protein ACS0TY_000359 [Phlomoides rotata]